MYVSFISRFSGFFSISISFCLLFFCSVSDVWAAVRSAEVWVREHRVALSRVEAEALAFHPSVLAAEDALEAAGHKADAAWWQFFPTPTLRVGLDKLDQFSDRFSDSDTSLTVGLRQPLYSGGRLTAQREQALAGRRAARHSLGEASFALSLNVVSAYGGLIEDRMVEQVYHSGLDDLSALPAIIQKRVAAQVSARADALLTETRYQAIADSFDQAQHRVTGDYAQLSQLVGHTVTEAEIGTGFAASRGPWPLAQDEDSLVARVLVSHPMLQRLQAERDAARISVAVAKSAWLPKLALQWEHERHSRNKGRDDQRVELQLSMDLNAGLSDRSNYFSAKATQNAASHAVIAAKRNLHQELERLFTNYRVLYGKSDRLSGNVERLEALLSTYQQAFLLGRRSWLDVLNMLREDIQARADLARTQAQLFVVRVTLEHYQRLGGHDG